MNLFVEWIQSYGPYDAILCCRLSAEDAIRIQKKNAASHNYVYDTDSHALDDFVTIQCGKIIYEGK